ncbi:TonB-dependent siderophore receptor [Campylobacter fetus]|nr:TonB-dependent siderophore receptor [Campylobacter fetus]EJU9539909.1 TonB-dependent siderophore receptor [Campylobacter fetus]
MKLSRILLSAVVAIFVLQENTKILANETNQVSLEAVDIAAPIRNDDKNYNTQEIVKSTTRLDLNVREIPQSLSIITEAKLRDLDVNDYQELLRHIPGVTLNKWDERVYPTIRGFSVDYYLLDSMPSFGGFSLGANDMSLIPYERVEVVKGANGLLAGAGNPAASINFIRKRADSRDFKAVLKTSGGSYDKYGISGDILSPLNKDGNIRGRLSFSHDKSRSFMDYYKRKNDVIYTVIDADVGDNSWVSLAGFYQDLQRNGIRWGGMPAFYTNKSRTNFSKNQIFSQPWTRWDIKTLDFYADYKYFFRNDAVFNYSYSFRRANTDSNLLYYGGNLPTNNIGNIDGLSVYANKREENIHNIDSYLTLPYAAFDKNHEFVFGAMYNNYKKSADNVSSYWNSKNTPAGLKFTSDTILNFNNLYINDPRFPYIDQNNPDKTIQKAIYMANKFQITDYAKFLVGGRMSYWKYSIEGGNANRNFTREITPYIGIVYDLNENYSLYASYTSIFKPQNKKDINGKYLDPIEGKDYEVGIKAEYFGGALQTSFGLFKIEQDKLATAYEPDIKIPGTSQSAYIASKGVLSKGFEIDVMGDINSDLSLSFGLTHFKAEDAKGMKYNTEAARTTANLFAKYTIQNLRIGGGILYKSKIYVGSGDRRITQNDYALVNLMLGYKINKNFDIQLNIDNLFDKRYYEGIGANKMVYGDPRLFNLTFSYNF